MKATIATGDKKVSFDASRAKPTIQPGEVLVKVRASPINPSDLLNINGGFPTTKFPVIPGRDYAGEVVEPTSSAWHGKHVYGTSGPDLSITRDGTHAEYVVIPEDALAEAPTNMELSQASMVGTPWTTAWLTLQRAGAKAGDTVLVTGAGGGVGSAVVQLAKSKLWRCRVLTAGRGSKYDVDVTAHPDLSTAKELTDGKGPDVVVDTTGDLNLAAAGLKVLSKHGRLSIITTGASRGSTETTVTVDFKDLYRLEHSIVGCNSFEHSMQEMASFLTKLKEGFESGELPAPDVSRFENIGIEGVADAYRDMGSGSKKHYLVVLD
ncbi:hypothetical protein H2198_006556 [Neophaeococcomyces mojaviensis]|uniref:Uncharacterized protein n=1 Tax=Neophaeococcomyces mojaviensis TaxID=3383035 RepID=A0ACC3A2K2_9EURO|nr:hypothetical protein H2198_006556 [Knufia sp. JES_112]